MTGKTENLRSEAFTQKLQIRGWRITIRATKQAQFLAVGAVKKIYNSMQ
jgi:hypothetical protein